jgi:hypothetical protein
MLLENIRNAGQVPQAAAGAGPAVTESLKSAPMPPPSGMCGRCGTVAARRRSDGTDSGGAAMDENLIVATYRDRGAAEAAARALEGAGVARDAITLFTPPDADPAGRDLALRDRLEALGVPVYEAQLLADMVVGGAALVAARVGETPALAPALAVLGETPLAEPLATFRTKGHAAVR